MTRADDRLLEPLEESDLVRSPRVLSANTDYSRHYISTRLGFLHDAELVDRLDEGLYQISARDRAYLVGEIDGKDLEKQAE